MLGFALMASIGLWVWLRPISTPEHPMRVFALVIMVAFSVGLVIVAISDTIRAYRDVKSRDEYLAAAQTANE